MARESGARPYEVLFFRAMKDGPMYGYQLAARLRSVTGGHIKVSYGTIYPFLRRMERRGVIRSKKEGESGRIYYELTSRGREAEEAMTKKMNTIEKDMEEKLLGILCMYSEMFGRKALRELLKRANSLDSA